MTNLNTLHLINAKRRSGKRQARIRNNLRIPINGKSCMIDRNDCYISGLIRTDAVLYALRIGGNNTNFARLFLKFLDLVYFHSEKRNSDWVDIPSKFLVAALPCLRTIGPGGQKLSVNRMFKIVESHKITVTGYLLNSRRWTKAKVMITSPACIERSGYWAGYDNSRCRKYRTHSREWHRSGRIVTNFWEGIRAVLSDEEIQSLSEVRRTAYSTITLADLINDTTPRNDVVEFVKRKCDLNLSARVKMSNLFDGYKAFGGILGKPAFYGYIDTHYIEVNRVIIRGKDFYKGICPIGQFS